MFGSKNTKAVEDESIKDKSKFVVVGFAVMVLTFIVLLGGEIYTSIQLSKQIGQIANTGQIKKQSDDIIIEMAKKGKDVNKAEYEYIKEILKFMSPSEFQNFKNSLSGLANDANVQILSLNEGKPTQLGKNYSINYIEFQLLSSFNDLTNLKNKIAENKFKININQETIVRENPISNKVLASGSFAVYVFPGKEKLISDKMEIIKKFEKEEADLEKKDKKSKEDDKKKE